LYCCLFYELIIQIGLWFTITFFTLLIFKDTLTFPPSILQLILWIFSGIYFIYSWKRGGQTLAMRAWKLKLVPPNNGHSFYFLRYLLVTIGVIFFLISFFWAIFNKKNQYLHDFVLGSEIIDVRI
tara:strand:- start:747 stop:1121 length:375 start_codon:yes stop_codon:yes gene_type:complete